MFPILALSPSTRIRISPTAFRIVGLSYSPVSAEGVLIEAVTGVVTLSNTSAVVASSEGVGAAKDHAMETWNAVPGLRGPGGDGEAGDEDEGAVAYRAGWPYEVTRALAR